MYCDRSVVAKNACRARHHSVQFTVPGVKSYINGGPVPSSNPMMAGALTKPEMNPASIFDLGCSVFHACCSLYIIATSAQYCLVQLIFESARRRGSLPFVDIDKPTMPVSAVLIAISLAVASAVHTFPPLKPFPPRLDVTGLRALCC